MKTLDISSVAPSSLPHIVQELISASQEDRVVRLRFTPRDYVAFSRGTVDFAEASKVPELFQLFGSFQERIPASSRIMTYSFLVDKLLELNGARPCSRELYDVGQIIYRFK